jgi:hypothetical protein
MARFVLSGFALCLLAWFTAVPVWAQAPARRVAVVVGVGAYQTVPPLANPPRDARAIAEALKKLGFDTTLVVDPDRNALERAIRTLGDKSAGAEAALFFFAGHGVEAGGHNYIVPTSAKVSTVRDLPFEAVDLDLLSEQLEGRARTVMVFLDACRDNPFAFTLSGGDRGLSPGRGLAAPVADASGTLIAFATAPGRTAQDGDGLDSPFTTALLKHLDTPGLEVRQMLGLVRKDVREATDGKQIPWESSALEGSFYFHPVGAAQIAGADEPPQAGRPSAPGPSQRTTGPEPSADASGSSLPRLKPPAPGAPAAQVATNAAPGAAPGAATGSSPGASLPAPPPFSRCRVRRFGGIRRPGGVSTVMTVASDGRGCGFRIYLKIADHTPFDSVVATTQPTTGKLVINNNQQII